MNIVLEGHDNSGKSTLAAMLAKRLGREIYSSEGPEKYPGELALRVSYYNLQTNAIFDRHPCVSDLIYSIARGKPSSLSEDVVQRFYAQPKIFIYCDPLNKGLGSHVRKEHDSDEHMAMVESKYKSILYHYRVWAIENAHIVYRIGDDPYTVLRFIEGKFQQKHFDPIADVEEFMEKFGQAYGGLPRALPTDLALFREDFMEEETSEYKKHSRHLAALLLEVPADTAEITHQLAEQLDAIVDKIYIDIGTSLLHGFDLKEAWRRVHSANMQKERVARRGDSTRHSLYDIVKPSGWTPPSHVDLVENHVHRIAK